MYSLKYLYPLTHGVNDANIMPIFTPAQKGGRSRRNRRNRRKSKRNRK
jgi:hypothetical protein